MLTFASVSAGPVRVRPRLRSVPVLALVALCANACDRDGRLTRSNPSLTPTAHGTSTVQVFRLSDEDLRVLIVRANAGDNRAAYRLSEHFLMGVNQPGEALHWLHLAASREDLPSQLAFASLLHIYGNDHDAQVWARRALAHATSAADEGTRKGALDLLAEIERRSAPPTGPR